MSTTTFADEVAAPDKKPEKPAAAPAPKKAPHPLIERYKKPALIIAAVIAAIVLLFYAYDAFTHEETDDAYVTGHLHQIASRVNGTVTNVMVDDNQRVKQGDVLVKLDPSQYLALAMAAKANLDDAQANYTRLAPLIPSKAVSKEDVDKALSTLDTDKAEYALAELQIQYCTISAPADGYVGRKNVEVGNRISSGQTLMDVVEPDVWVVANFKETQLAKMRVRQPATITVDSIPGKVFTGTVDSFSPATGNEFALLPADNSTGNFTKIVQRVPVKIIFNRDSVRGFEDRIRAGESAIIKVALTDPKNTQPQTQPQPQ